MTDFKARVQAELNDASLSAVESKLKSLENTKIELRNVIVNDARFSQSALNNLQKQLNNLTANIKVQINGNNAGNLSRKIATDIQSSVNHVSQTAYNNIASELSGKGIKDSAIKSFLDSVSHDANKANIDVTKLSANFKQFQKGKSWVNGLEVAIQGINRETGAAVTMTQKWDDKLTGIISTSTKFSQSFGQGLSSSTTSLTNLVAKFKEMSQIRITLNGLDEGGKNAEQADALKSRYSVLSNELKKLVSEISGIPISNLQALSNAINDAGTQSDHTSDRFDNLRTAIAQAVGQNMSTSGLESLNERLLAVVMSSGQVEAVIKDEAQKISSEFSSVGASTQKINDLQSAITSLGTYGAEAQQKLDGLKQTANNITGGGLNANQIVAEGAKAKQAFADVEAAVKIAKEAMALDNSKAQFGQQLKDQLSRLTPETEKFRQDIVNLQTQLQKADSITFAKLKAEFAELTAKIKEEETATKDAAVAQETLTKSSTLSNKIEAWMNQNTKAAREYEAELRQLQDRLNGNTNPKVLKEVGNAFNNIKSRAQAAGLTVSGFGKSLKNTVLQVAGLSSAVMVFQKAIQVMKDMYKEVVNVDTAMTELYRVTNLSSERYAKLYDSMVDSAKKYGASLDDMINSTASWVRLGFDAEVSNKLAEITSMYQHVTDLDEDTAVNNLVTAYKGFQKQLDQSFNGDEAEAIRRVADIYDKLGKRLPMKDYIG